MDLKIFLAIAGQMRDLQREFFGTKPEDRRPNLVMLAKRAEKRFDEALEEMRGGQRGLFDREEED
jgi:hypothetical protein